MIDWAKVPSDAMDVVWKNEMRKVDREIEKNMPQTCRKMLAWTDSVEKRGFRDASKKRQRACSDSQPCGDSQISISPQSKR